MMMMKLKYLFYLPLFMLSACAHWVILPFDTYPPGDIYYFDANSVKYRDKEGKAYAKIKMTPLRAPKVQSTLFVIKKETYHCREKTKDFTGYLYIHNIRLPKSETETNQKVSLDNNAGSAFLFKKLCGYGAPDSK